MAPINSHVSPQQLSLFGRVSIFHLSATDLERLYESEEGMFRRYFLELIPKDLIELLYSTRHDVRPARYAIAHVAGLFLAEIKGLTEKEFLAQLPWSIKLLHAVGIDEWNDSVDYGRRTFTDLYKRINDFNMHHPGRDILHEITHRINYSIAEKMDLFHGYDDYYRMAMRLDSTMINSSALPRTRLEIITIINVRLLREMNNNGKEFPKELSHYFEKHHLHSVAYYKGTQYEYEKEYKRIIEETKHTSNLVVRTANRTLDLITRLTEKKKEERKSKNSDEESCTVELNESERKSIITFHRLHKAVSESELLKISCEKNGYSSTERYADFLRMIDEQTYTDEDGHLTPKDSKQIDPESMQSPFDPDATYRFKAGKSYRGYIGMIVSVFDTHGKSCVVEDWLQKNTYSDQRLMEDFHKLHDSRLDCTQDNRGMVTCDAGFISIELNNVSDKKYGWDTYCAGVHGDPPNMIFAEFVISDDGKNVLKCPTGGVPLCSYSNGTITARFKDKRCQNCDHKMDCSAKTTGETPNKGSSYVKVSKSKVAAAMCRKMLQSDDRERFLEYINKRNAIEGDNSVLKRKYHINVRTRSGIQPARHALYIADTSSNWRKYFNFLKAQK